MPINLNDPTAVTVLFMMVSGVSGGRGRGVGGGSQSSPLFRRC